jgi:hypothetical protein
MAKRPASRAALDTIAYMLQAMRSCSVVYMYELTCAFTEVARGWWRVGLLIVELQVEGVRALAHPMPRLARIAALGHGKHPSHRGCAHLALRRSRSKCLYRRQRISRLNYWPPWLFPWATCTSTLYSSRLPCHDLAHIHLLDALDISARLPVQANTF